MNQTMNIDDMDFEARLTAYVLGELDADQAAAIEARLESDPSAQAAVAEIRRTAEDLSQAFSAEPAPPLTSEQRQAIEAGPAPAPLNHPGIFRTRAVWWGAGTLAAAAVALAFVVPFVQNAAVLTGKDGGGFAIAPQNELDGAASAQWMERRREFAEAPGETGRRDEAGAAARQRRSVANAPAVRDPFAHPAPPPASASLATSPEPAGQSFADASVARGTPLDSLASVAGSREMQETLQSPGRPRADGQFDAPQASLDRLEAEADFRQNAARKVAALSDDEAKNMLRQVESARRQLGANVDADLIAQLDETEAQLRERILRGAPEREGYDAIVDNPFIRAADEPLSTLAIDVDTAAYANVRRFLDSGRLPPKDAVRIEELINYFTYDYAPPAPNSEDPFAVQVDVNAAPWAPEHRLVKIGLKGREIAKDMRPATNLVFLLDVSGSMNSRNKLPLVKQSMLMLLDELNADDRVAIVTYAGNAGVALDSTYVSPADRPLIEQAINGLGAGGSTNGAGGINAAYAMAESHFIEGGVNRVILCTDGDFNVGVSSDGGLVRLIEEKRQTGVFLSVFGFGSGNVQMAKMEKLSQNGNGVFGYIDSIREAKKAFVEELAGTLVTIAKDVKVQVDFNRAHVGAYRLIGYENRLMAAQDFRNDAKDAGEIGAGHTVTFLFEVVPAGAEQMVAAAPKSKYAKADEDAAPEDLSPEMLTVFVRYKDPDGIDAKELEFPVVDEEAGLNDASADFRFAAGVAAFGMILRDSPHKGGADYPLVLDLAGSALGADARGYRSEFVTLVEKARAIAGR